MKILITGGAGFIGSNLADELVSEKRKDSVTIIDNLHTGRMENINKKVNFINGSIEDIEKCNLAFECKPDVVVHAAASYKNPDDWELDTKVNTLGTINIVRKCLEYKVPRLIYFQTSLCYGPPQKTPITLKHQINPRNSYAISKTAGEQFISMSGLDFVSLRLANCYGPRNLSGPVPTFYKRLSEGKKCFVVKSRRDFVYITDLIHIVLKAIDGQGKGFYHISSGEDVSILKMYQCVCDAMYLSYKDVEIREREEDDVETILLEPGRIGRHFNFIPNTTLHWGVEQAVEWYKKNEIKETFTHLRIGEDV